MATHGRRVHWFDSTRLLGLIKEYIDEGDAGTRGPSGPPGPAGPRGPQGEPGTLPPRGEPVALAVVAPATSTGIYATTNPDGSVSLSGAVDVPGPRPAGDPFIFTYLPPGTGPGDAMGLPVTMWSALNRTYLPGRIDLNPSSTAPSAVFLLAPKIETGDHVSFDLDGVTYWPPPVTLG